jgi:DHA1 family tetracycline resistance protein-like MFS transporter
MKPLLVVALTVVLDLIGFGIVIPTLPYYAHAFDASDMAVTLIMAGYSLAQFLCVPLLGQVSDRVGRRPVLLASIGMTGVMLACLAASRSLWMVVLFRVLHGAMTANIGTAQACIADLTTPENRARGMGLFGAAFGVGFTLGPPLGGELSRVPAWLATQGLLDPLLPFLGGDAARASLAFPMLVAALLSLLNFVLAWRFLPETRHAGSGSTRRSISPRAFLHAVTHPAVGLCVALSFLQIFSFSAMEACFTLFAEDVWSFGPHEVGRFFGLVGVLGIVMQGGLIGPLVKRFGEARLIPIGFTLLSIGLALTPLARPDWTLGVAFSVVAVGQALATPTLQALISRAAGAHEQGAILGSAQSMGALARATGPAFAGMLYSRVSGAAPFWASAVILAGCVMLALPATARARAAQVAA